MRINILFKKGCYESNTLYGFSWKRKTQPIRWHPKSRIKGWETNIRWVPSPISSASITWVCLDHENRKKFNPSSWYGCSEPSYIHEYEIEVIKFVQIWLNNMIEESIVKIDIPERNWGLFSYSKNCFWGLLDSEPSSILLFLPDKTFLDLDWNLLNLSIAVWNAEISDSSSQWHSSYGSSFHFTRYSFFSSLPLYHLNNTLHHFV